jgi:hypothetical protein
MNGPSETQMHTQPNSSNHPQHDVLAVAALADRGGSGEEADRARAQIETCGECAALHADLVNLAAATRQLPPIERPRDFQLRPADAQRLRPNLIRRLFGSFGTPRDGFSRPLAMGLTTLGLAGMLLGILPGTLSLGGASSGSGEGAAISEHTLEAPASNAAAGAPAAEPAAEPAASSALAQRQDYAGGPLANPAPAGAFEDTGVDGAVSIAGEHDALTSAAEDGSAASALVVISGTLLIVGLGLFALRWTSRRFGG